MSSEIASPSKRLLLLGAVIGASVGAALGIAITLLNLGGKGDWMAVVPGMMFNGAFLGVCVGAIIREQLAGERREPGRLRRALLWLAVGLVLSVAAFVIWLR